jgi:hypothetical protein
MKPTHKTPMPIRPRGKSLNLASTFKSKYGFVPTNCTSNAGEKVVAIWTTGYKQRRR